MGELLNTKVGQIKDEEILALIRELEDACPVGSRDFMNTSLFTFLTQCVYHQGPQRRIPISTKFSASTPILESRVGKLPEGPLRTLCGELALLSHPTLEFFNGNKLYSLLNKTLPKTLGVQGPSEKQRRWDAVVGQRRSNRS